MSRARPPDGKSPVNSARRLLGSESSGWHLYFSSHEPDIGDPEPVRMEKWRAIKNNPRVAPKRPGGTRGELETREVC
jgi:hypothetical protein